MKPEPRPPVRYSRSCGGAKRRKNSANGSFCIPSGIWRTISRTVCTVRIFTTARPCCSTSWVKSGSTCGAASAGAVAPNAANMAEHRISFLNGMFLFSPE
ncbi:hypothetical protein D3C78_1650020 [compost metagenome]